MAKLVVVRCVVLENGITIPSRKDYVVRSWIEYRQLAERNGDKVLEVLQ